MSNITDNLWKNKANVFSFKNMQKGNTLLLRILLFPFSFLFGVVTCLRNKLYDWKMIPSVQYDDVCVISVGNITVGGTGKTPFVEFLVRLLSQNYRVAVLSRGYKRATKGFLFVGEHTTPGTAGDEPYQIKQKFPDISVAVDANRIRGIANIRKAFPDVQVILLDDAFQYRKIKPNLSILLADYHRPLYRDVMLPGGRLREWAFFAKRADIMAVTKSPAGISPEEQQKIKKRYARIFPKDIVFSTIGYGLPKAVFSNSKPLSISDLNKCAVLLITGISHPQPFEDYLRQFAASVQALRFPDHHAFSEKDVVRITEKWNTMASKDKVLITTEKDAVRLQQTKIPDAIAERAYYVPIEVKFSDDTYVPFITSSLPKPTNY